MNRAEWVQAVPGRLAALRLRGSYGGLDLLACHMPTGVMRDLHPEAHDGHDAGAAAGSLRAQREALARRVPALPRPLASLTLLAGDFNFVVADSDRWNKLMGEFSGNADRAEATHWRRTLLATTLYGLLQEKPTHAGPQTLGRLDRAYTNQAVVEQLDRHAFALVLPAPAKGLPGGHDGGAAPA